MRSEPSNALLSPSSNRAGSGKARRSSPYASSGPRLAQAEGALALRYDPANVHWFDAASGRRIEP